MLRNIKERNVEDKILDLLIVFLDKTENLSNEEFLNKFQFHRRTIERQVKCNTRLSKKYLIPVINFLYPQFNQYDLQRAIGEDVWSFIYINPQKTRSTSIKLAPVSIQLSQVLAKLFNEAEGGITICDGKKLFGDAFYGMASQLERYGVLKKSSGMGGEWFAVNFKDDHPILFELWKSNFGK